MTINEALINKLNLVSNLTSIVGEVYSVGVPESGTLPAVVLVITSQTRTAHLGGSTGIVRANLVLTCFSYSYDQALKLGDLVTSELNTFRGSIGGIEVLFCYHASDSEGADFDGDGDGARMVHSKTVTFSIGYRG